jgi:bifunctional DNA-binding transcriptional regulator/antitoxin component of YhaV-PrlF toxin-antitoxin module
MSQALVKLQRTGAMVIPRPLREAMGVAEGSLMKVTMLKDHRLLVTPQLAVDRDIISRPKNRKQALLELGHVIDEIRQEAKEKGLDKMSMAEINRAVAKARRDLKKEE